jgi:hypothetical protein
VNVGGPGSSVPGGAWFEAEGLGMLQGIGVTTVLAA